MTITQGYELATDAQFRELSNFSTPPRAGRVTAIEASGQVRVETDDPDGGDVLAWPLSGFTYAVDDVVYIAFAVNSPDSAIVIGSLGNLPTLDADVLAGVFVRVDGTTPLTGDWNIGEDRAILAELLKARDAEGLTIQDDGGNVGISVLDGGGVQMPKLLDLTSVSQLVGRLKLSGQEFFQAAHTDTDGPILLLGVNRSGNRQIWFADSALLAVNSTNPIFRLVINTTTMQMGALATDGVTLLPLNLQGSPVGINIANPGATNFGAKAGASSNDFALGGVLYETTTQTGNVGAGEDDLASYSVPVNTLSANGMSVWFEAAGTCAANVNAKTLRVRFGTSGTNLIVTATVTGSGAGAKWIVRGRVVRTGAAAQKGYAEMNGSNVTTTVDVVTGLNQTLSGAVTLKITGEATSNNDIVLESFTVGWDDQNT